MHKIDILFPVLNEETRLEHGIEQTLACTNAIAPGVFKLHIVDNGSSDKTPEIAYKLANTYYEVEYIHADGRGVGLAFRTGVNKTDAPIVGYMDIDLATSPSYLADVMSCFDKGADIVNASRWAHSESNSGRPLYRKICSRGLVMYLKKMLALQATDAVCGFKFFRRETVEDLISAADNCINDWTYIIELLVRAEKAGMNIYELPVRWQDDGNSSVKVFSQTKKYLYDIAALRSRLKKEGVL